ncbi:MAG: hypothetical protein ACPG0K_01980 [Flavobacteriaceae bacterium]
MITTISFFKYNSNKFWAFRQMVESHKFFENNPKIIFYKLLGTGAGDGFLWPDFSTYSILILWKKEEFANEFISKSDHSKIIEKKAYSRHDYFMQPIQTHGLWDGINPFKNCLVEKNKEDKIGIITRGKVRLSKQIDFWLNVPQASNAIKRAKDVEFYKGIGELPFLAQATFSVWKNLDSVMNFAYKSKDHSDIIKKTRKRNWYSEDMFTRFIIKKNIETSLN